MQRAMAKEAEAERERRAKIMAAEGEFQASPPRLARGCREKLGKGALRVAALVLQTLVEIAAEKNSTTIFPVPIDLLEPFVRHMREDKK